MSDQQSWANCPSCGKQHRLRSELAGRKARCTCGNVFVFQALNPEPDPLDALVDPLDQPTGPAAVQPPAPVAAAPKKKKAVVRADIAVAAARQQRRHEEVQRARAEAAEELAPSPVRDWFAPLAVLALGIALLFVEATTTGKNPAKTASAAMGAVALRGFLGVGLMLVGMFLATRFLDVGLIGSLGQNLFKACAIAIGPAGLNAILQHHIGDLGGALAGVFASVIAYALLFRLIMRTDAQGTSICVVVTWTLITFANYMAYKVNSAARGSWI